MNRRQLIISAGALAAAPAVAMSAPAPERTVCLLPWQDDFLQGLQDPTLCQRIFTGAGAGKSFLMEIIMSDVYRFNPHRHGIFILPEGQLPSSMAAYVHGGGGSPYCPQVRHDTRWIQGAS